MPLTDCRCCGKPTATEIADAIVAAEDAVTYSPVYQVLSGTNYSSAGGQTRVTIEALVVATGVTVTTSAGAFALAQGQKIEFVADRGTLSTPLDVTTGAGDVVAITEVI